VTFSNSVGYSYDSATNSLVAGTGKSLTLNTAISGDATLTPTQAYVTLFKADGTQARGLVSTQVSSNSGISWLPNGAWVGQMNVATNWQGHVNLDTTGLAGGSYRAVVSVADYAYATYDDVAAAGGNAFYDSQDGTWGVRTSNLQITVDATGNVTRVVSLPNETEVQQLLVADSSKDQVTKFGYDKAGRQYQTIDALGYSENYQYDAVGNKIAFTNKSGSVWTYQYDKTGRLIQEATPQVEVTRVTAVNGTPQSATTSEATVTRMAYDAFGNLVSRTEAYGTVDARTTQYQYDKLGHQTKTIYPSVNLYDASKDTNITGLTATQSSNVKNYSWGLVQDPNTEQYTLQQVANGLSLQLDPATNTNLFNVDPVTGLDLTPTSVTASIYRVSDNALVNTVTTATGMVDTLMHGVAQPTGMAKSTWEIWKMDNIALISISPTTL
jgi:YD repeat-containing protein